MQVIKILDGGMGQALLKKTNREISPMWSADVMLHEPELVRDVHLAFIEAGAKVITLNTYTATPPRLKREKHLHELERLHKNAIEAAQTAIRMSGFSDIKIAGCLPPLVASYKAAAALPYDVSYDIYQQLVHLQKEASDLFLCETMSSISEASAACKAAQESKKPVWLGFTVKDDNSQTLRSGEPLQEALTSLAKHKPQALLLNCSQPEAIKACWPLMQESQRINKMRFELGAYANGFHSVESLYPGDTVEHLATRKDLSPRKYADFCKYWAKHGASIIGGCCEIGPEHIAEISKTFKQVR